MSSAKFRRRRFLEVAREGGVAVLLIGQCCCAGIDLATNTSPIGRMETLLRSTGAVSDKFGYLSYFRKRLTFVKVETA